MKSMPVEIPCFCLLDAIAQLVKDCNAHAELTTDDSRIKVDVDSKHTSQTADGELPNIGRRLSVVRSFRSRKNDAHARINSSEVKQLNTLMSYSMSTGSSAV